jgi:hypothetical protein
MQFGTDSRLKSRWASAGLTRSIRVVDRTSLALCKHHVPSRRIMSSLPSSPTLRSSCSCSPLLFPLIFPTYKPKSDT